MLLTSQERLETTTQQHNNTSTLMNIIDQINLNLLLTGEQPKDGYKLFSIGDFFNCDDIAFWQDLTNIFGVDNCILVSFVGGKPNTIINPSIWVSENNLVFRIGNTSFDIYVDNGGIYLKTDNLPLKLSYDTSFSANKEYFGFSFLVENSLRDLGTNKMGVPIRQYDCRVNLLYKEEVDPTKYSQQAKQSFRREEYKDVLDVLIPIVKELPIFKNSTTLPQLFLHLFANGLFAQTQLKLGGHIAVLLSNPSTYNDKFGTVVEFDFDGRDFANRIDMDYEVKSWNEMKPLRKIQSVVFSQKTVEKYDYLKDIMFKKSNSLWAIMIVTGPNQSRHDWPPSISFIPDYLIKDNSGILAIVNKMMGGNFKFPEIKAKIEVNQLEAELTPKPKFLTSGKVKDFNFDNPSNVTLEAAVSDEESCNTDDNLDDIPF